MPRPKTNREVVEEIARSYEKYDRQELLDFLCRITMTYVIDRTMPFNFVGDGKAAAEQAEKEIDFVKLIEQAKRRLSHIPELANFQVEGGKVTLRAGNQKIIFGERVTAEFVPTSSAPPAPEPAPARPSAAATGSGTGAKPAGAGAKGPASKEEKANLSETQQEALNDIVTRFKNLELD